MTNWHRHTLTRAIANIVKLAAEHGIALQAPSKPSQQKVPRWSACYSIDDRSNGCVSVILPRWLSLAFLWWTLPRSAWVNFRQAFKPPPARRGE